MPGGRILVSSHGDWLLPYYTMQGSLEGVPTPPRGACGLQARGVLSPPLGRSKAGLWVSKDMGATWGPGHEFDDPRVSLRDMSVLEMPPPVRAQRPGTPPRPPPPI